MLFSQYKSTLLSQTDELQNPKVFDHINNHLQFIIDNVLDKDTSVIDDNIATLWLDTTATNIIIHILK